IRDFHVTGVQTCALPISELTEQRLGAGRYACTVHVGPYERLGETWARFMGEWLPASGYRLGEGVSYEIYVGNPMTAPNEEPRTEIGRASCRERGASAGGG